MINESTIIAIENYLKEIYTEPNYRYNHILNVKKVAISLAKIYGIDLSDVIVASLLHDITKHISDEENYKQALANYPDIDFLDTPIACMHAYTAMYIAEHKFNIKNREVLDAIRYHCSGRKAMTLLEKIIFVSDFIEESRTFVSNELRKLATENIDQAVLKIMIQTKEYILANNQEFSKLTEEAIDYYKRKTEVFND